MAFTAIKRAIMNAKFRKVNKHYATDYIFGERTYIPRKGKDPVEVLLYYPSKMENMPVFVQIHGGAWVGMDAVDDDRYCLRLSKELGALVVNVNYKRLYEHSFPYAHEEIVDTVKWLKENAGILCIDPEKMVLSGGSAGGHLTAGSCIMLAQQGISVAGQVMEVPFLDFTGKIPLDLPGGDKLFDMMFELYPSQIPLDSEVISPATKITDETLKKLAMAVVIVCGRDPLHLAGEAYAQRLSQYGKLLDLKMYEKGYHGFGTEKTEERVEQAILREDCFRYKVEKTKQLYDMSGGNGDV